MERIVNEHEIKTEHKLIREITKTYVTVDEVERLWNTHRGPLHAPGTIVDESFVSTDMKSLTPDVKELANLLWTTEINHAYEVFLNEQNNN